MMRAKLVLATVGLGVAALASCLLLTSELAWAQAPATTPPAEQKAEMPTMSEMMEHMKEMKDKMKLPPECMTSCCMMMCMEVKADDPAALLALKEQLKLTPAQLDQLKKIGQQAREDAGKVLTPEQKKVIEPIAKKACTMMEIHHDMMHKMGHKMGEHEKGPAMVCPLMKMMEAMEHKAGVKEEKEEHNEKETK